jgi:hypothetical protein
VFCELTVTSQGREEREPMADDRAVVYVEPGTVDVHDRDFPVRWSSGMARTKRWCWV